MIAKITLPMSLRVGCVHPRDESRLVDGIRRLKDDRFGIEHKVPQETLALVNDGGEAPILPSAATERHGVKRLLLVLFNRFTTGDAGRRALGATSALIGYARRGS